MSPRQPYYRIAKPNQITPRQKLVKRYLKFIAVCKNRQTLKTLVKNSPEPVIKGICNAAINAQKGDVRLTPGEIAALKKHRQLIFQLTDRKKSLKVKHQLLNQRGGWSFLPILLSAVLPLIGNAIFNRAKSE